MKNDYPSLDVPASLRQQMIKFAREFRQEPTKSEHMLWQALRGKKLDGIKFRRQQPIGPMIVDFYNSDRRLVIEVDGPIHDFQKGADRESQEILEMLGLHVLRISAELVEGNMSAALQLIRVEIRNLKPKSEESPSPMKGEGKGGG